MPSLPWRGLVAAWGAFRARGVTKPSAPSGLGEKGVAEQGTGRLCFPALPALLLLSRVPISVPMASTCQEAAAETPVPPPARKPDGRLVPSDQSIFARVVFDRFTRRKLLSFIQARKMQVLLPHIMEVFQEGDTDIKMKALLVFRNMMGHLKRKEASPIAVQLAEKLLRLFDDVRLMGETEPRRGALGNGSCPSAQP